MGPERPASLPRQVKDPAPASVPAYPFVCDQCEGDGSYSEMALCTTFDPGCGCSERVIVDPCPACGGSGSAPC